MTNPIPETSENAATQGSEPLLKSRIEALLFLTQHPLSAEGLAEQLHEPVQDVEEALLELITDYSFREHSALEIDDTEGYILQVKDIHADVIQDYVPTDLPTAVLRTLSVIALEGPMKQTELIQLRGSSAYDHVKTLLQLKLIVRKRIERSFQLSVSKEFYRYFQLSGDKNELQEYLTLHQDVASSAS